MAKVGRQTKMDKLTVKKLNEAFAFGCTDEEACFYSDISKQTLYNYQKNHPEFIDQKEALKQRPILLARQSVISGLTNDPNLALKFLERKKKDEFSLRQEFAGVKDQPLVDIADPQILKTLLKTAQDFAKNASSNDTAPPEQE